MNSPASDIKDILNTYAIGVFRTNLFVGMMPESPDACMAVYDTGGFAPASDYIYERPTVQVQVRGAVGGYTDAYNRAASVKNLLHDMARGEWGVSLYIGIWAMGDILFLGFDERNRPMFSVNFRIHRTEQTTP